MASNQPLSIFISSTSELLVDRFAAQEALAEYSRYGWLSENSAGPSPESKTRLDQIAACDVYICLLGPGYNQDVVDEIEYARRIHKPCLLYGKFLNTEQRDSESVAFSNRILQDMVVFRFETPEQLIKQVQADVMHLLLTQFRESRKQPLPLPTSSSTTTSTKNKGIAIQRTLQPPSNGTFIRLPSS